MAQAKSDWIVGVGVVFVYLLFYCMYWFYLMPQLHYAFQDANYLYMVMDYMPGVCILCICVSVSVCGVC